MALTVEDGTGIDGAESYISVTDANAYFTNISNALWTGTDAVKEAALRIATKYIESNYRFIGEILNFDQALLWPRTPSHDNAGREITITTIPILLKDAVCEIAVEHLRGALQESTGRETSGEKVGSLSVTYFRGQRDKRFPLVSSLLSDIIIHGNRLSRV